MRGLLSAAALAALLLVAACGDSGPSGPGGGGNNNLSNGTFTANVSGSAYNPIAVNMTFSGGLAVLGSADIQSRALGWAFVANGPGTYVISQANAPNNVIWTDGAIGYTAQGTVGSGSVTFTTLNANRSVGTFSFTVVANPGSQQSTSRTITGSFDITH